MKKAIEPVPSGPITPVRVIGSVFRLRRDLTALVKKNVLVGSKLTLEEADLLLDLYGAWKLGWTDPSADKDGFVAFAALKRSLVHSAASLSRGIKALMRAGLVERRNVHEGLPASTRTDRKAKAARITAKGINEIQGVYERYCKLSESLMGRMRQKEDAPALLRINEELMETARWGI